jgi:hypothetical protein
MPLKFLLLYQWSSYNLTHGGKIKAFAHLKLHLEWDWSKATHHQHGVGKSLGSFCWLKLQNLKMSVIDQEKCKTISAILVN